MKINSKQNKKKNLVESFFLKNNLFGEKKRKSQLNEIFALKELLP